MSLSVKNLTTSIQQGHDLGLLKRLQTMNASATPADRNQALHQLHELQMQNKEAINNFLFRFRSQIQVVTNAASNPQDLLSNKEMSTFFVNKSCANSNIKGDVCHASLDCKKELHDPHNNKTLTNFENESCLAKNDVCRQGGSRTNLRSSNHPRRNAVCSFYSKKGHAAAACHSNPANHQHQAHQTQPGGGHGNAPSTAGKCSGSRCPTCFHCGLPHSLNACPDAASSPELRESICCKKAGPRTNSGRGRGDNARPNQSSTSQANQASVTPSPS